MCCWAMQAVSQLAAAGRPTPLRFLLPRVGYASSQATLLNGEPKAEQGGGGAGR